MPRPNNLNRSQANYGSLKPMSESLPTPKKRQNKPGAGRPRAGVHARKNQGWFRCSDKDLAFIERAAAKKELTFSTFVFRAALFFAEKILGESHRE